MIHPREYMHPEDAKALREMESIPGFPTFLKTVLSIYDERVSYGLNMASSIRLSPTQLPELYNRLPPICEKLGIAEPEFYLSMSPVPNAMTSGDTRIYITITSGLVESMSSEELDAVIAHECGHIACRHVLYHSLAYKIAANFSTIVKKMAMPCLAALFYWTRKSELSCDRAASLVTSPQVVASSMAKLAGGPKSITSNINMEEWAKQADKYEEIRTGNLWDRALQWESVLLLSHPFFAVRVREILKWGESDVYKNILANVATLSNSNRCPKCKRVVAEDWAYCNYCGEKLK